MYISKLLIHNYRSCRQLDIDFEKDDPTIFIGINDCGKTTILKAIGLLLDDKSIYHFVKDNSSKKDFSNSPLAREDFLKVISDLHLPEISYTGNETIIIGKFIFEDQDIDTENLATYTSQLLWAIENSPDSSLWLAKIYDS